MQGLLINTDYRTTASPVGDSKDTRAAGAEDRLQTYTWVFDCMWVSAPNSSRCSRVKCISVFQVG